jgi:hypothetical protein
MGKPEDLAGWIKLDNTCNKIRSFRNNKKQMDET